ncbi:dienelactone hydrolase family protein [Nocardia sp. NPDC059246]|uniref:dienelactone hydrolase family protein n=1 Tax=unclassified Nocardia TaxID=2637762 RepID=UPI0036C28B90
MISVDGLTAYLSQPVGGSRAGMLLLPMITGIAEQVRDWADELAASGVTALSWDPWEGRPGADETPANELFGWMSQLDDAKCLSDQTRLLDYLHDGLGCERVGVIGWCMGGRFALLLAGQDNRLANVVAYHPTVPAAPAPNHTLDAVEHAAKIQAPVMMHYAGADAIVPVESLHRLQSALNGRDTGASIVHVYPGAGHGFSARDKHDNPVNAAAFAVSWPQALSFIHATTGIAGE